MPRPAARKIPHAEPAAFGIRVSVSPRARLSSQKSSSAEQHAQQPRREGARVLREPRPERHGEGGVQPDIESGELGAEQGKDRQEQGQDEKEKKVQYSGQGAGDHGPGRREKPLPAGIAADQPPGEKQQQPAQQGAADHVGQKMDAQVDAGESDERDRERRQPGQRAIAEDDRQSAPHGDGARNMARRKTERGLFEPEGVDRRLGGEVEKAVAALVQERGGGVPAGVQAGHAGIGEKGARQAEELLGHLADDGRPGDDLEQQEPFAQAEAEHDGDDHGDDELVVARGGHLAHQPGQEL